jgi:hypothetical protein
MCFLHNEQLGLVKEELVALSAFLNTAQSEKLNKLLALIPPPRYGASLLKGLKPVGTFQGPECHSAIWNLPLILNQVISTSSDLYQLLVTHSEYYRLMWKHSLNEQQLQHLEQLIIKHHKLSQVVFPHMYEEGKFPYNFHLSQHWPELIRMLGMPRWYSNQANEHKNKISRNRKLFLTNHSNQSETLLTLDNYSTFTQFLPSFKIILQIDSATLFRVLNCQYKAHLDEVASFWKKDKLPSYWKGLQIGDQKFHTGDYIVLNNLVACIQGILAPSNSIKKELKRKQIFLEIRVAELRPWEHFKTLKNLQSLHNNLEVLNPDLSIQKLWSFRHPKINSGHTIIDDSV